MSELCSLVAPALCIFENGPLITSTSPSKPVSTWDAVKASMASSCPRLEADLHRYCPGKIMPVSRQRTYMRFQEAEVGCHKLRAGEWARVAEKLSLIHI